MKKSHQEPEDREAYPKAFSEVEKEFLKSSRLARGKSVAFQVSDCTGVGLSGGGIRSATFCLGVFQGLASLKKLDMLDFISTVSGGGYFGSFYTRYFLRQQVPDFKYVQDTLAPSPRPEQDKLKDPYQRNVINWLRENGRYLSPRGSGDLLLAGAVLLRNWIVVQIVIATFFLLLFLTTQLLGIPLDHLLSQVVSLSKFNADMVISLPGKLKLWLTPFVAVPVLLFLFWAVPLGWAYWMVGRHPPQSRFWKHPATVLVFVALAALMVLAQMPLGEAGNALASYLARVLPPLDAATPNHALEVLLALATFPVGKAGLAAAAGVLAVTALTALWWLVCELMVQSRRTAEDRNTAAATKYRPSFQDDLARHWVSVQLKVALVAMLAALALVTVDSLGQTIYLVLLTPGASVRSWSAGLLATLIALAPFATRIMLFFRGANGGKRPSSLTKIAAAAAAFIVIVTLLTTFSVAANALAWTLEKPLYAPADIGELPAAKLPDAKITFDKDEPNNWSVRSEDTGPPDEPVPERNGAVLWVAWSISIILSWLFGQCWPFLNRSTQLPLYSSRLTRAYLGASNPRRFDEDAPAQAGGAVTRVIWGDDIELDYYWPWPAPKGEASAELEEEKSRIFKKGTPLHLVNVTINETLDGKSQVQQQDRKGIGMALGPAGISAGVRHHALLDRKSAGTRIFPESGFRVFDNRGPATMPEFSGERLTLGQMLSISGAAFSTGLGARTNLALSLLAGIGNIRLGYWWNSGIEPQNRSRREKQSLGQRLGGIFTRWFPVQSYLLDEYTARYHGTARQYWYLSDGGHFENMAGYELIRRRLRLIVIIDAEADPDYNFEGMSNLARKARIDLGAEIKFLQQHQLDEIMPPGQAHCFGTLDNLRRGKWVEENLPSFRKKERKRQTIDPVDQQRYSLAHAAIATVSYDCRKKPESCLIYLKPTLIGNEPLDVLQYHAGNPSFPQQTTIDQFFDEAQWESYRTLGEHIATEAFKAPRGEDETRWLESLVEKVLQQG